MSLSQLPALNACLNGLSAVLLAAGFISIQRKNVTAHRGFMGAALVVSTLFLISYLYYHAHVGATRFLGTGWTRPAYFTLLGSHTVLAVLLVPFVAVTFFWAWRGRFDKHKRLARWTWPLWMYVSVTGVLIYFILY
jgi:uncharacterized membrane protein YozB (DUF420 family)